MPWPLRSPPSQCSPDPRSLGRTGIKREYAAPRWQGKAGPLINRRAGAAVHRAPRSFSIRANSRATSMLWTACLTWAALGRLGHRHRTGGHSLGSWRLRAARGTPATETSAEEWKHLPKRAGGCSFTLRGDASKLGLDTGLQAV